MQTIPLSIQHALVDWLTGRIYVDRSGNYRSRLSHRLVPRNRELKRRFPHHREFEQAAEAWLSLWEVVPR
jgi:hypothetical protein